MTRTLTIAEQSLHEDFSGISAAVGSLWDRTGTIFSPAGIRPLDSTMHVVPGRSGKSVQVDDPVALSLDHSALGEYQTTLFQNGWSAETLYEAAGYADEGYPTYADFESHVLDTFDSMQDYLAQVAPVAEGEFGGANARGFPTVVFDDCSFDVQVPTTTDMDRLTSQGAHATFADFSILGSGAGTSWAPYFAYLPGPPTQVLLFDQSGPGILLGASPGDWVHVTLTWDLAAKTLAHTVGSVSNVFDFSSVAGTARIGAASLHTVGSMHLDNLTLHVPLQSAEVPDLVVVPRAASGLRSVGVTPGFRVFNGTEWKVASLLSGLGV